MQPHFDCTFYLERFFPAQVHAFMERQDWSFDLAFALDIQGPGGGQWSCRWEAGKLELVRGHGIPFDILYRTDLETFVKMVHGEENPANAFFAGRVQIEGDMEKALLVAVLFQHFIQEIPYRNSGTDASYAIPS